MPVIRFSDPAPLAIAVGGDPTAPQVYGIGEARFDRHLENGQARQWNVFVERQIGNRWMTSIGYSASVSRNLGNRSFPIQNQQILPAETLALWRQQYIDSNGTLNPATQLVPNPCQPTSGPLLPFAGILGQATIARQNTLFPYPLLVGSNAAVNKSEATADYHALLLRVNRRFADGFMMDVNYTFSRNHEDTDNVEDNQGFNAGGSPRGDTYSLVDASLNRHIGYSDVPHRFVGTFLYELPFGTGKPIGVTDSGPARHRQWLAAGRFGDLAVRVSARHLRFKHRRVAGPARPRPRRRPRAAGEPVGLVRRPHRGHFAERPCDHAGEPHLL